MKAVLKQEILIVFLKGSKKLTQEAIFGEKILYTALKIQISCCLGKNAIYRTPRPVASSRITAVIGSFQANNRQKVLNH